VVEHLAVLRRHADCYREIIRPQAQLAHQWAELNRFRPGAENNQDAFQVFWECDPLPIISRLWVKLIVS
jgi:hypothetical protein